MFCPISRNQLTQTVWQEAIMDITSIDGWKICIGTNANVSVQMVKAANKNEIWLTWSPPSSAGLPPERSDLCVGCRSLPNVEQIILVYKHTSDWFLHREHMHRAFKTNQREWKNINTEDLTVYFKSRVIIFSSWRVQHLVSRRCFKAGTDLDRRAVLGT